MVASILLLARVAYRCSRVIHQSAMGRERSTSSSSWRRQIVNNSAAPTAAPRFARGKIVGGHAAPGHESALPSLSDDSGETFGPGARLDPLTNTPGENLPDTQGFLVSISHEDRAACEGGEIPASNNTTSNIEAEST
jgi:hypothetical protein